MDLTVSPDLDAYYCYALVILFGALTALFQIRKRLGNLTTVWRVPQTWLLFAMYLAVPVGLFWLLDRSGAVTDSSFFAAVLVGFGYVGILSGNNQSIRPPAELSSLWTPFVAYADTVSQAVLQRASRNQTRLINRVIASILADTSRYPALEALALRFASDPAGLAARLAALSAPPPPPQPPRPASEVLEDKVRLLFAELLPIPDVYYLMKEKNVISSQVYWMYVKQWNSIAATMLLLIALFIGAVFGQRALRPFDGRYAATYYQWRLLKPNSTKADQNRSRIALVRLMRDRTVEARTTENLAKLLRQPDMPLDRVDLVLRTLLETRARPDGNPYLPVLLVPALRADSVDARTRINDVLKYLAGRCEPAYTEPNPPWKPNEGDSTAQLEEHVAYWADYWSKHCVRA